MHSEAPTDDVFKIAPRGVVLTTENEVKKYLSLMHQQIVVGQAMPLSNKTNITKEELSVVALWLKKRDWIGRAKKRPKILALPTC